MRLIDADELIENFLNHCRTEFEIKNCCMANENVIAIIQNAPTVERPKGEWIKHIDDLYPEDSTEECSSCHEEQRLVGNDDNFCPNCGADMRKEASDE